MRRALRLVRAGIFTAVVTVGLEAPTMAATGPLGCYERIYGPTHLAAHPAQDVRRVAVVIGPSPYGAGFDLGVLLRTRGWLGAWHAGGHCMANGSGWTCRPDTDGASDIVIEPKGKGIRVLNRGRLKVYDEKTGPDLNDRLIGGPSDMVFDLDPAPSPACRIE